MKTISKYLLLAALCSLLHYNLSAQWTEYPLTVSPQMERQAEVHIANNDKGDTYIFWENWSVSSGDNKVSLRLQHYDKNGNALFQNGGIVVSESYKNFMEYLSSDINLVVNKNGEAIVTFLKVTANTQIAYAHKYDANGTNVWSSTELCYYIDNQFQSGVSIALTTNENVAYAIPTLNDMHINMLLPDGTKKLTEDIVILGVNMHPQVVSGLNGSFYVVYQMTDKIFADHYDSNCEIIENAKYIGNEIGETIIDISAKPDGKGGVVVMWNNGKINVQRIDIDNVKLFDEDASLVTTTASISNPVLAVDEKNATIYVAYHSKNTADNTIQLQRIDSIGVKQFGNKGISIDTTTKAIDNAPFALVVCDDSKLLVFANKRNPNTQVYELAMAKFLEDGMMQEGFTALAKANSERSSIVTTNFFNNQVVVAWSDKTANETVVKSQNISYYGVLGAGAGEVGIAEYNANSNLYPSILSANESLSISLNAEQPQNTQVQVFDILGNVRLSKMAQLIAGQNVITLSVNLPVGMYSVRMLVDGNFVAHSFIVK
ncbi:MAG: T9SS type A sorting domain-containing protein [Ignavibacteria bacterium]|nr:T9SS type A sorting domain-containing protein [Ignavibacteria bacterium]